MTNDDKKLSFPKGKMKVLLLENIHESAQQAFLAEGYQVESLEHGLTSDELKSALQDVSILGIRSSTQLTDEVLDAAPRLLAVGAFCIGTNQIDLQAAASRGIAVFNAPFSNTRSVVELAVGGMIALSRRLMEFNLMTHQGTWKKSAKGSHELRGQTLGIIGYGNIGSQLSVLAENLGLNVIFYDTSEKLALGTAKKAEALDELLAQADIISLHVDGRTQNKRLISKTEFSRMKKGALFLNLSRGNVVDQAALVEAIESEALAGAFLDVYEQEPKSSNSQFENSLQQFPNVIMTPHIGGATEESQDNIGGFVSRKLTQFIDAGNTDLSVNLPQLSLPKQRQAHRLIHIHQNIPGALSQINQILADSDVNIEAQYLGTKDDIGYVITDINMAYKADIATRLREAPGTIRVRVLY